MNLFGFDITKKLKKSNILDDEAESKDGIESFAPPLNDDGAAVFSSGAASGYYGQVLDLDNLNIQNEKDLIKSYRTAAAQPECDMAINDIVNAAIVGDSNQAPVNLILDDVDLPDGIKKKFKNEFDEITKLLKFNFSSHDIFRRWYIDGKLYYHLMIDSDNLKKGIQEVRLIDPLHIRKVKEVTKKVSKKTGEETTGVTKEYYLYGKDMSAGAQALKIDPNVIVYVPSGTTDETQKISTSYIHKSVKLVNQLRVMEDALVIYRISRAPERRIFYIDIGNLPKGKAEEYVQGIMSKYRNKLVYDATTGEVQDESKSMSMLEDFWLPRREGGRGTEITTLPGGENLSQIDDVIFFQKKLYRSLNVPLSRLDSESTYNAGRVSEISREEVKFQKFINRIRRKFSVLFIDMLRVQCLLKRLCTEDEWSDIEQKISIDFIEDNYFSELKDFEILRERITMLEQIQPFIGKYYSKKWVKSNVLNFTEEDTERIDTENNEDPVDDDEF
jgi:hypothetical protein